MRAKGNDTRCVDSTLHPAACAKRFSWGDEQFCPALANRHLCPSFTAEAACHSTSSCKWYIYSGGGSCSIESREWDEIRAELSQDEAKVATRCHNHYYDNWDNINAAAAACNNDANCGWQPNWEWCEAKSDVMSKMASDLAAPPGVSAYYDWSYDPCWFLSNTTCDSNPQCEVPSAGPYKHMCAPTKARELAVAANGCGGHADFEKVAQAWGTTMAEAHEKSGIPAAAAGGAGGGDAAKSPEAWIMVVVRSSPLARFFLSARRFIFKA